MGEILLDRRNGKYELVFRERINKRKTPVHRVNITPGNIQEMEDAIQTTTDALRAGRTPGKIFRGV